MKKTQELYKQIWRLIKLAFVEGFTSKARVDILLERDYLLNTLQTANQIAKLRKPPVWASEIEIPKALTEIKTFEAMTDDEIDSDIDVVVVAGYDDYKIELSPKRIREMMKIMNVKMEPYEESNRSVIRLTTEQLNMILSPGFLSDFDEITNSKIPEIAASTTLKSPILKEENWPNKDTKRIIEYNPGSQ